MASAEVLRECNRVEGLDARGASMPEGVDELWVIYPDALGRRTLGMDLRALATRACARHMVVDAATLLSLLWRRAVVKS